MSCALGPKYLHYIVKEMKDMLNRGYMVGMTSHSKWRSKTKVNLHNSLDYSQISSFLQKFRDKDWLILIKQVPHVIILWLLFKFSCVYSFMCLDTACTQFFVESPVPVPSHLLPPPPLLLLPPFPHPRQFPSNLVTLMPVSIWSALSSSRTSLALRLRRGRVGRTWRRSQRAKHHRATTAMRLSLNFSRLDSFQTSSLLLERLVGVAIVTCTCTCTCACACGSAVLQFFCRLYVPEQMYLMHGDWLYKFGKSSFTWT